MARLLGSTPRGTLAAVAIPLAFCGGALVVVAPAIVALCVPLLLGIGLIGGMFLYIDDYDRSTRSWLLKWTAASFFLHLVLSIAITSWGPALEYLGGDSRTYHDGARAIADHWSDNYAFPRLPPGKEGFYYLLAVLYTAFGPHALAGLAVNAALSACLVPLTFDTTARLFGTESARRVVRPLVLIPSFLIFTAQLLREPGVLFLLAVAINASVRLRASIQPRELLVLAASISVLFTFRANVAFVFAIALVIGLFVSRSNVVAGLSTGASFAALLALLTVGVGIGYSGYELSAEADIEQVAVIRDDSSRASSGFGQDADISSAGRAVAFLPAGVIQFLAGPFPWQIRGPRQLPAALDVAVLWWLAPSLVRGLRSALATHGRRMFLILTPAILLTIMLSLFVGNFGTLVRERLQVTLLLLPLIAHGRALRSPRPSSTPIPVGASRPA